MIAPHYMWTFCLCLKSDTFVTLTNIFTRDSTQFGCTIKNIQYDNNPEFDNTSTFFSLMVWLWVCRIRTPHCKMDVWGVSSATLMILCARSYSRSRSPLDCFEQLAGAHAHLVGMRDAEWGTHTSMFPAATHSDAKKNVVGWRVS
jgi:hypothetical protein